MLRYSHLLSPLRIGDTVIKNRLLYPNAPPHMLQGPEDYPSEAFRAFYTGLAKNGAAIITLGDTPDTPENRKRPLDDGMGHVHVFDWTNPAVYNYFSQMADEIHFYGSKLIFSMQLSAPEGFHILGSFRHAEGSKVVPDEMLPEVIETNVQKMRFFKNLGFDGVSMRVDYHMVPQEGMPPMTVAQRMKPVIMFYSRIKQLLGRNFICEAQIAGEQPAGYTGNSAIGYSLEEAVEFANLAQDVVDILQIREKDMCKSHPTGFTFKKGEHEVIRYSMAVKASGCKIYTLPIGGFQDPDELDSYIAQGKCDMIGAARAFMCDFDYGKKLYAGKGEDVRPCLWCNKCHGTIIPEPDPYLSICSVNPIMGLQHKLARMVDEAGAPKKVAVIGGGPAGMNAAVYAAQRGHSVTLFEKTAYLGGQMKHAESFAFKWPIKSYRDWLVRSLGEYGVEIRLNSAPSPDEISSGGYDAVLAATGARAKLPGSIVGLRDENGAALYPTCHDIFGGEASLGKRVIIVGGSETGMETAMYLADHGHDVTVLTRQDRLGHDCSDLHYITMTWVKVDPDTGFGEMCAAWEKYDNIKGITGVVTKSVCGGTVTYCDASGAEHSITGDSVVICGGTKALIDEAMGYSACADRFFVIGDCNGAGSIQKCVREAFSRASII